jgi:predicted  nucleic acid-binding Zn-ribbon protein
MIEPIMYFGIGFLVAALLALMFIPLVHNRAVRLTMRRLEAATPLTMAEIRADKDQLRAEFAMSTRRLELSVEQMKTKATTQLAEIGKKSDAINQLKKELGEKTAAYFALEARDRELLEQLRSTEREFEIKSSALREAERTLADKEAELSKLVAELGDHSISADTQRVELAALRTQVEAMKVSVADYEDKTKESEERLARARADSIAATTDLTDARGKLDGLNARTNELERQLLAQTTEAELLSRRVQELEARLGDQGRRLAERDYEVERLSGEADAARKSESDLRRELASAGKRSIATIEELKSEIAKLQSRLAAAVNESEQLHVEIAKMTREAEAGWAAERVENALLRERINDVAAEVARLTAALEGPDSPIEALLSGMQDFNRVTAPTNGNTAIRNGGRSEASPAGIDPVPEQKTTLADRIRALQSTASRVASSN